MNMLQPLHRTLPAIFCVAIFLLTLHLNAVILPAEKLLPDDTLVVVSTPDFSLLRDFYRTSSQTRLWNDPAMKPFADKFISKLREEFVEPLERELSVKFDDYTSLPQGQLTFAITQNGWQGASDVSPAVVFLLDTKGKSGQLKTNLTDLRRKWVDAGKTIKTEKIREIEFTAYLLSDKDIPATLKKFIAPGSDDSSSDSATNSPSTELLVGQVETLLIAGTSAKVVEKILAHVTGGSAPCLADVPAFEANRLAIFRDAPFYGWANAKVFLDLVTRKPAKDDSETPDPLAIFTADKIISATGFGAVKTLAFAGKNDAEGSFAELFITAPASARQSLLQLIPSDGKESSPPPFVPADVIKFQRTRLDGQKAWATLQKIMNDISPQIMDGIKFALDTANTAAKQKDPEFDLQKNLFGNLGDDMISYSKAPRGTTMADVNSAPSLFLLGSPRPEELANALKSILVLATAQGATPSEREFLGRKIYSVQMPSMVMAAGGASTLNYAASGNYVAITTDTAMIEEYLRRSDSQQKALRETPGLMDAMQKIGGASIGIFGYQNTLEVSRVMFEAARKTPTKDSAQTGPLPGMDFPIVKDSFKDWMDFTLLPPFDQVSKYFYFSVYGISANADGVSIKMFAPVPPELKK